MDTVIHLMKEKGQRFTSQKKEVFCALRHKPQTVLEILTLLNKKKISIDKATVYRILTNFVALGVAREVFLDDRETRFELLGEKHHHHLVCEECGGIEDVVFCEDVLLDEVKKQSSFKIKSHSLEFFGICRNCQ
jgi:Fe2+ or Zn2+ uptake regulation protein